MRVFSLTLEDLANHAPENVLKPNDMAEARARLLSSKSTTDQEWCQAALRYVAELVENPRVAEWYQAELERRREAQRSSP